MDFREQDKSLEDEGLFFCQLCQKDLTAMNSALREQHVNRCLDQEESFGGGSEPPQVPSCPLCGKPFSTEKMRASHLKRCAAKLEVPAQTLLEAVQRQAAESGSEGSARPPPAPAKRKAGTKQKEPRKKRKVAQSGTEVEDMLVAMALSRSLQEDPGAPSIGNKLNALPNKPPPAPEKKGRRKKKAGPAPLLLVQAPEAALQKLQGRMSLLLSEEPEVNNIIPLPPSRFWDKENKDKAGWSHPSRVGKNCALWENSNMMEKIDSLNYYTEELNPPITPWNPPQKIQNSQPQTVTPLLPVGASPCATLAGEEQTLGSTSEDKPFLFNSQKDRQALLDLAELAGEGMTLTQWNQGISHIVDRTGRESLGSITPSGFISSHQEDISKPNTRTQPSAPLVALARDFKEMVNNPHLSDAQLQTDCGEVLNVHMFVLYARCPLLVEAVHTEGFWVDESSMGRVRRLLLNDVSAEAALCFLNFLYSAHTDIADHCLPHVCELARRFSVGSLIDTCEQLLQEPHSSETQYPAEDEGDDGGERAETFQELLKSMWVDEDDEILTEVQAEGLEEEERMEGEGVGEGELEEIYEFAATQRRVTNVQDTDRESSSDQENGHHGVESEDSTADAQHERQQALNTDTDTQHPAAWQTHGSIMNTTASPNQVGVIFSPFKTSMIEPSSATLKSSFAFISSVSPAHPTVLSSPSHTACVTSSSEKSFIFPSLPLHSTVTVASPICQQFVAPPQPRSLTRYEKCRTPLSLPVSQSITSISQSLEEDAEQDLFGQHSPPILDDSFDRMFSDTCGEYAEPSSISDPGSSVTPRHVPNQNDVQLCSPPLTPLSTLNESGSSPNFHSGSKPQVQSEKDIQVAVESSSSPTLRVNNSDSPHPAPTSHSSCWTSPAAQDTSCLAASQEQEVILILSSDEETESSTHVSALPRNVLENIKESPMSFCERRISEGRSRLEMSSSTETSWLIPATPMLSKVSYTSQLQTSTLPEQPRDSIFSYKSASPQSPVLPAQVNSLVSPPLLSQKSPGKSPISKHSHITQVLKLVSEVPNSTSSKVSSSHSLLLTSPASSSVFEVEDSEEEVPPAEGSPNRSDQSFHMDYEPPIHMEDDLWFNREVTPKRPCHSSVTSTPSPRKITPAKSTDSSTPLRGSPQSDKKLECPLTTALQSSQRSFLNPQLWDHWEEEEDELPAILPLSERLSKASDKQKDLRTPVSIVRRRELAPKVPITPLPDYSDLDTPVLKKELNKFGVRALPKKQMVLKLKEIFRYTHQTMNSDSEDDVPTSQLQQGSSSSTAQTRRPPTAKQKSKTSTHGLASSTAQTTSNHASSQVQKHKKPTSVCATGISAQETDTGGDQPLTASQESNVSCTSASDTSLSQSSTANEFEMGFADEDDDEPIAPSQVAGREAATAEAVRRFIEERPDLYKRILLYQPLELAALQTELKQAGIKMAAGKLLDFLDARCVTFTTAAARKEKKSRGRRKGGKRF
ncbi:structure-specific endonuclease subunit SLX4 isoform 2-T2 [Discoglossus pictus]